MDNTTVCRIIPVECPVCSVEVPFPDLKKHFQSCHNSESSIITSEFDKNYSQAFFMKDILPDTQFYKNNCIFIMSMIDEDGESSFARKLKYWPPDGHDLVFFVFATRVNKADIDPDSAIDGSRIIIWLASNIATSLKYAMYVYGKKTFYIRNYVGPMLSIRECDLEKLTQQRYGIVMKESELKSHTCNGDNPVYVVVMIYKKD